LKWPSGIPFDEFRPSPFTEYYGDNYSNKPDLHYYITFMIIVSSRSADGGWPESNTIWIDEIAFE